MEKPLKTYRINNTYVHLASERDIQVINLLDVKPIIRSMYVEYLSNVGGYVLDELKHYIQSKRFNQKEHHIYFDYVKTPCKKTLDSMNIDVRIKIWDNETIAECLKQENQ